MHTTSLVKLAAGDAGWVAEAHRLSAQELVRLVVHEVFPGRIALTSSFGTEAAVLLHMVSLADPTTPVLFIDTGKLFGETLRYRHRLAELLGLKDVRDVRPPSSAVAAEDPDGMLFNEDHDACCHLRKVEPLDAALEPFEAWITGRKRVHGGMRSRLRLVEHIDNHVKINPLAEWNTEDVADYMARHDLPFHPLVEDGYTSVGCYTCTEPPAPGDSVRSGRWAGTGKTECGIHLSRPRRKRSAD